MKIGRKQHDKVHSPIALATWRVVSTLKIRPKVESAMYS
jgi:hypothetical protein